LFSSVLQRVHRSFRLATHLRDADAALYRAKGRGGTDSLSAMSFRPNYEPQMNQAGQESQSRKAACCPTGAPSCSCSENQPSRRWRAKEPSVISSRRASSEGSGQVTRCFTSEAWIRPAGFALCDLMETERFWGRCLSLGPHRDAKGGQSAQASALDATGSRIAIRR
jgi:hypothetical protein